MVVRIIQQLLYIRNRILRTKIHLMYVSGAIRLRCILLVLCNPEKNCEIKQIFKNELILQTSPSNIHNIKAKNSGIKISKITILKKFFKKYTFQYTIVGKTRPFINLTILKHILRYELRYVKILKKIP